MTTDKVVAIQMSRMKSNYLFYLICVVLAVVTFAAFEQVRHNDFVDIDDGLYVTGEPHVSGGISFGSVLWAFTKPQAALWHPLTLLSHMLDCQLFGLNPGLHHLTGLLFHIANTLLLFWVLKDMTGSLWQSGFVAAAFAFHPLHVESVAWISGRKDVLSGFFWILTMAAYLRYVRHSGVKWYMLTLLSFVLGLMAKPMVVTLPFVLLLLDYWPLGRFEFSQGVKGFDQRSHELARVYSQRQVLYGLVREKVPFFVFSVVFSVVAYWAQKSEGAVARSLSLNSRIANALVSYVSYLGKMINPSRLACIYPHPGNSLPAWQAAVCFVVLAAVTAAVVYAGRRRRYLAVGWLWYVGTLVPVIGLIQIGSQAMADRYTYLPLIGIFIMVGWGSAELFGRRRYEKVILGVSAGVILTAMLIYTRVQVGYWHDNFTLFEHALAVTKDNSFIECDLGNVYQAEGRLGEAISHYYEALRITPGDALTHNNLGSIFLQQGKLDEAISCFLRAVEIKPDYADAYYNLGLAFKSQGKLDEAIGYFRRALKFRGDDAKTYNELGMVLQLKGGLDEALVCYREAIRLKPDWPLPMSSAAWILAAHPDPNRREPNEAIGLAEQAVRLTKSQDVMALDTLAAAYFAAGQFERAIKTVEAALALASAAKNEKLVNHLRGDLEVYKRGKP